MATTNIQVQADASLSTPTCKLWAALTHGTADETVTLTEDVQRPGMYAGTVTGALAGWYHCDVYAAGVWKRSTWIYLVDDTGTYVTDDVRILDARTINAAIQAKTDLIGRVTYVISGGGVTTGGSITIKAGDYHSFTFTSTVEDIVPDLNGETIRFGVKNSGGTQLIEKTAGITVDVATGLQSITVVLLPSDTVSLSGGAAFFDIQVEYDSDDHRTFMTGSVTINPDYSGVP